MNKEMYPTTTLQSPSMKSLNKVYSKQQSTEALQEYRRTELETKPKVQKKLSLLKGDLNTFRESIEGDFSSQVWGNWPAYVNRFNEYSVQAYELGIIDKSLQIENVPQGGLSRIYGVGGGTDDEKAKFKEISNSIALLLTRINHYEKEAIVNIEDFAMGSNVPNTPLEDKAIFEKLEARLLQMKKLLEENRMNQGALQMWIGFMRAQLVKIYGRDSDIPGYFLPIKGKLTKESATEIASDLVERVEAFLHSEHENAACSLAGVNNRKIFIGHGRSPLWREVKDFLTDRLGLSWDEFNRESVAGYSTFERISQMLDEAGFALLIMSAEDEHADMSLHARENVIHEVGLFQGKLGPKKAIILLEDGCKEFSNIIGLSQIRFPKGHISAAFEEIRRVLEREGILES